MDLITDNTDIEIGVHPEYYEKNRGEIFEDFSEVGFLIAKEEIGGRVKVLIFGVDQEGTPSHGSMYSKFRGDQDLNAIDGGNILTPSGENGSYIFKCSIEGENTLPSLSNNDLLALSKKIRDYFLESGLSGGFEIKQGVG